MRKATFSQRLRYAFDNTMSRGTPALIAWLGVISIVMILVVSVLVELFRDRLDPEGDFWAVFWRNLLRTLDPGTMGGDTGSVPFLMLMLLVTLGGIFIVSTLIGVLSSGIEAKIDELRKGRSLVIEQDHTLILGWSDQIFTVLHELVEANANRRRPVVVVLADKDKIEMEDEIRTKVPNMRNTRVVCRTGSPLQLEDLEIVNPHGARSIIALSPPGDDPDSQVIKSILAITNNSNRRSEPYHIVAEIHDPRNLEAARLVGGDEASLIDVGDTISRLIAQTCRQTGLSVVYNELLDFSSDEIYFKEEPALVGKTFAEALFAYETSSIIGIMYAGGQVRVHPAFDTVLQLGDRLIAVSDDDDTIKLSGRTDFGIDESAIQTAAPAAPRPERVLVLGWNRRAPTIINELDHYVAPGSTVLVVASVREAAHDLEMQCGECRNLAVTFREGDTTDRRTLDSLRPDEFEHIVVLCYSDHLDAQRADAKTLITLLHLRDIEARIGERFSIVSEMMDDRNRELAEVTKADDFIVSDKLLSLMLAQVSENKHLARVFSDMFDPEGSEIYVRPAADYVVLGRSVNLYTVLESARRHSHIAIGYIVGAQERDDRGHYGVHVNPPKSEVVTFTAADRIVIIAED
ncbi:MAG TPA: potassium transporter TrkA [Chloroflexia bacterium]|nr:potassium transporter TrkA [Chloroflexia bacterium]